MTRQISEEQKQHNVERFQKTLRPVLLGMVKYEDYRTYQVIIERWETFEKIEKPFNSCYLYGNIGAGKTVDAVWMMLEWARLKYLEGHPKKNIIYIPVETMLSNIRNTYESNDLSENVLVNNYINCNVVKIRCIFSSTSGSAMLAGSRHGPTG